MSLSTSLSEVCMSFNVKHPKIQILLDLLSGSQLLPGAQKLIATYIGLFPLEGRDFMSKSL